MHVSQLSPRVINNQKRTGQVKFMELFGYQNKESRMTHDTNTQAGAKPVVNVYRNM